MTADVAFRTRLEQQPLLAQLAGKDRKSAWCAALPMARSGLRLIR